MSLPRAVPAAAGRAVSFPPRGRVAAPVRAARGPLDLQSGFAVSTRQKMTKSLEAFRCWLLEELGLTLPQVLSSQRSAALALRAYGLALFEGGFPRYLLVYAITAVQDICPEFRSHLTPAWQIDKKWQLAEPGSCRPVISRPVLLAALSLALLWGWNDWAAITLLGFLCMLHPNEFIALTRGDLVLPVDALSSDRIAYIHIGNPKTARFTADLKTISLFVFWKPGTLLGPLLNVSFGDHCILIANSGTASCRGWGFLSDRRIAELHPAFSAAAGRHSCTPKQRTLPSSLGEGVGAKLKL